MAVMDYHCDIEARAAQILEDQERAWFCLRTQIKHEGLAAAHLRRMEGVEVLFPRMVFKRKWRETMREFTEPLFPNYLFARFNPRKDLARARHAHGVQTVVHFGNHLPVIPESVINEIRQSLSADQICRVESSLAPGDVVTICGGAFSGLQAIIKNYLPRKQRVILLLEFLGRQVTIEVGAHEAAKKPSHPLAKI